MTDPLLKDLLGYHQALNDVQFSRQLLDKIQKAERKRRLIMLIFTVVGLLISAIYFWSVLPLAALTELISPINGLLLFGIGLVVVWLWTEELASG